MVDVGPPATLDALAEAHGVATSYQASTGERVRVRPDTLVAVLQALGVDASTPETAAGALREVRSAPRGGRPAPPVVVTREGATARVPVRRPPGTHVEAWVELEDGETRRDLPGAGGDTCTKGPALRTPADLPPGWHRLHVRLDDGPTTVPLVVTPARLAPPERAFGLMLQLYALRSRRSWGIGDLRDLADLASFAGRELGAGFVLVNPLHATGPCPPVEPSPYFPSSRRYVNPLYIRVEDVPEHSRLASADRDRIERLAAPLRERAGTADLLDRDAALAAKLRAIELLYAVPRSPERQAAFDSYRAGEGDALRDFATWCAIAERYGPSRRRWPAGLRHPGTADVARLRAGLADRVAFHCYLQWLIDEQLGATRRAARAAGMSLGVIHDLAVGVDPDGADAWAMQDQLASGVTVGAPPDAFNQQGQDWRQPPWHPGRLAEAAYAPYRDMLRGVLRHAGGVRVDHILGCFRLWWIPAGAPPSAGTYVRMDHDALVGILALEARRAGAAVIGEDLGTVEPRVRDELAERGVLGTSMLWFEKQQDGRRRRPEEWREGCLATVGTHDLPPAAGYLAGEHVAVRERLGLLTRPAAEDWRDDLADRRGWLALLRELHLLDGATGPEVVEALHAFLAVTPARLIGVALADAVGARRAQNQPGTTTEYPNWRLPLADGAGRPLTLEDVRDAVRCPGVRRLAAIVARRP